MNPLVRYCNSEDKMSLDIKNLEWTASLRLPSPKPCKTEPVNSKSCTPLPLVSRKANKFATYYREGMSGTP